MYFVNCTLYMKCFFIFHFSFYHLFTALLWNLLQRLGKELPELRNGWDVSTFTCGMWRADGWTEAHDVELWIFAEDNRALKTCVANLYGRLCIEEILVNLAHQGYHRTVRIWIPASIVAVGLNLHTHHRKCT